MRRLVRHAYFYCNLHLGRGLFLVRNEASAGPFKLEAPEEDNKTF